MAIEYTWKVLDTKFTLKPDRTPDRITSIDWQCVASEGELAKRAYGQSAVDLDASTATEQEVIDAAKAENPEVEDNLAARFDAIATPTAGTGKPWLQQFPVWRAGVSYAVDDVVNYQGTAYVVIQAHTSQVDWIPPLVPALFNVNQDPADPEWAAGVQYGTGDLVNYQGTQYECIQAHTSQVGWEPTNVPALWLAV